MGDFNSRLPRSEPGYVGRWNLHKKCDAGGERLLELMKQFSLRCTSTYFQPPRKHSNATYLNKQPEKPPSQIDHILVSARWSTSVRNCSTKWGPSITTHGRKYDHAMVAADVKIRLKMDKRAPRKDFKALQVKEVAAHMKDP